MPRIVQSAAPAWLSARANSVPFTLAAATRVAKAPARWKTTARKMVAAKDRSPAHSVFRPWSGVKVKKVGSGAAVLFRPAVKQ